MARLKYILIAIAIYTASIMASADGLDQGEGTVVLSIKAMINEGNYTQAYDLALSVETAEGYALASESLARRILLGETERPKRAAKQARELANMALQSNPSHQNALLQYAIMDGFIARKTGRFSAWVNNLPQESYDNIMSYRRAYPDDERGDALLGAWHLGIVQRTGQNNAEKWFKASVDEGVELFEAARQKSPDDVVILLNYAFSLIVLSEDDFHDQQKITDLLKHLQKVAAKDDLEQKLIRYGAVALTMIEDPQRLEDYAQGFLEGETPEF